MTDGPESNPSLENAPGDSRTRNVERFCNEIIRCLRLDLEVEVFEKGEALTVNFAGPDRPMLLSNAAVLLNSLEYLINKAFRSGRDLEVPSILMDSENYRKHREAELVLLARMASQKVIEQRRPLSLQPMIPRERRIVHLAIASIEGVRSESEGEGENRSVSIYPA